MRATLAAILVLGGLAALTATGRGEDAKDPVKGDLARMQGRWECESLEQDGKAAPRRDTRNRTLFFGGDRFLLRNGAEVLQAGTAKLDSDAAHGLDMAITAGTFRGVTMLGIYELKGDTLKVCLDTAGRDRPSEYKTSPDSGLMVATYKREKAPDEVDIAGIYDCAGTEMDGNRYTARVEIRRVGDAYAVSWTKGTTPMHVGVGLRKGNVLSVSFANPGMAGIAVYQIEKDRKLQGEWTELGGIGVVRTESLAPAK